MQVEIWFDVVCPWCYLGKRRFERALESFASKDEVTVVYRSFELDPFADPAVTVPTVNMLAGKYGMSAAQAAEAQRQMERRAADDGLEFHMAGLRSGSTRDAHRLIQLGKARGRQHQVAERLFRAYFTEQASVFDHASLTELAVDAGLDRGEVTGVLGSGEYGDAVEADGAMARALGATGVPLFVIDRRYGISGAQPADVMRQALERASAYESPVAVSGPFGRQPGAEAEEDRSGGDIEAAADLALP